MSSSAIAQTVNPPIIPPGSTLLPLNNTWSGINTYLNVPVWPNQTANTVYSGPATGAAATPSFRALTINDLPASVATQTYVTSAVNTSNATINNASAFGLICDGDSGKAAANATALQNWANAFVNNSLNYLPPGDCRYNAAITFPTTTNIEVAGHGTQLTYTGSTAPSYLLTIGVSGLGGSCSARGWNWHGVRLESTTTMLSNNWAVKINDACNSDFNFDVAAQLESGLHNLYNGVWLNGGNTVHMYVNTYHQGVGFQVNGSSTSVQATDIYLSGITTGGLYGVVVAGNVGGLVTSNLDVLNNEENFRISQDIIAHANSQIFFGPSTFIDITSAGGSAYGLHVLDAGGLESIIDASGTWFASAGNSCIQLEPGTTWNVNISGGYILNCGGSGLYSNSAGNNINVVGTTVARNVTYGLNNGAGTLTKCGVQFYSNGTANTFGVVGSSC